MKATMMIDLVNGQEYCIQCYLQNDPHQYNHAMMNTHHAVRGSFDLKCHGCNSYLTVARPIEACAKCTNNGTILLLEMSRMNLLLDRVKFRFNNHTFELEHITLE